jgi:tetratricopeptide (TPR) repeat protein
MAWTKVAPSIEGSEIPFGQLQIELKSPRQFTYQVHSNEGSVDLAIKDTLIEELTQLDYYDDTVIKRSVLKQLNGHIAHVKLFLRNPRSQVIVRHSTHPFRIIIDIFGNDQTISKHDFAKPPSTFPLSEPEELPSAAPLSSLDVASGGVSSVAGELDSASGANVSSEAVDDTLPTQNTPVDFPSTKRLPFYIYRLAEESLPVLTTAELDPNSSRASAIDSIDRARESIRDGRDAQAKRLLDQAIKADSNIFMEQAGLLWIYAELTMFSEDYELANGYYEILAANFPSLAEAQFAKIRQLDVRSFRAPKERLIQLADEISTISLENPNEEMRAWLLIRQIYWHEGKVDQGTLPVVSEQEFAAIAAIDRDKLQEETSFILDSFRIQYMAQAERPWQPEFGLEAQGYFSRHKDKSLPFLEGLRENLKNRLHRHFVSLYESKDYTAIITHYEALPKMMQSIKKSPPVAYVVADALRKSGEIEKSITSYLDVIAFDADAMHKLEANFYAAHLVSIAKLRNVPLSRKAVGEQKKQDAAAYKGWSEADEGQKSQFVGAHSETLDLVLKNNFDLRSSAVMNLYRMESGRDDLTAAADPNQAAGSKIQKLTSLSATFRRLNMPAERRSAMTLLSTLSPDQEDPPGKQLWVKEMQDLSEEYRQANDNLKAGQILKMAAEKSVDWDRRPESLYKSALLLIRAGRRDEARGALQAVCNDDADMYYQTLSCERLAQLENP